MVTPHGTTIAKVEFYNERVKIGEVTSAPYHLQWTLTTWGTYHITAVAIDTNGNHSQRSAPITLDVPYDQDANGMADWWEIGDLDNDGMPNGWESANGLDPQTGDADIDSDGDGLSNFEEMQAGTNPNNYDTDGDSISDSLDSQPTLANPYAPSSAFVSEDLNDPTKAKLHWQHDGANVTGFLIQKKISSGNWVTLGQVGAGVYEYSDQGIVANQNYYYRVKAMNVMGGKQVESAYATTSAHHIEFIKASAKASNLFGRVKEDFGVWKEFPTDPGPAVPKYYLVKTSTASHQGQSSGTYSSGQSWSSNGNEQYSFVESVVSAERSYTCTGSYSKSGTLMV